MESDSVEVIDTSGAVIGDYQQSPNGKPLPTSIRVGQPRIKPNELRVLKALTNKTLEQMMADEVDAMQVMVWCALRRAGYNPTWEQAGDVEAELVVDDTVDPTNGSTSTTSQRSATSGA